jgi:RHS repeat-associated protein
VVDYAYDHTGLRVSKRVDDGHGAVQLTNYLGTHAEIRAGVLHKLIAFAGLRIAVVTGADTFYLHNNPTGTSTLFTDATGERIGELDLHPFGNEGARSGKVDFQRFGLHPVDPESGLVYMRRRYYSPEIGRFLTPDLMALHQPEKFIHRPSGLHLYAYVANDPMNRTDPEGLSFWSIVGAVVGVAVGVVVGLAIIAATGGLGLVAFGIILGVSLGVTGVSYLIASEVDPNSAFGQFVRGFMIGFNAGLNGVLVGGAAGTVLGVIDALAAIDGVARNSFYQGVLGWSSWLMPMSWAATALGAAFYVFNLVAAGVTGNQWSAAKIDKLGFDWNTGTFVMLGGLIRNGTAFSMGHFVLMDPSYVNGSTPDQTYDAVLRHETGHTLENGAFGSAFLAWDFVGENIAGAGGNDYGEEIAESHANRPGRPTIPMWG